MNTIFLKINRDVSSGVFDSFTNELDVHLFASIPAELLQELIMSNIDTSLISRYVREFNI